ncbi:rod-binding protein [Aurantimonas sp. A2-1-M11]|uniref:rod-binding protein n=1 Tax=Aurantimonas sp. A2-1-M11 TaxID=3113712 RepID=UPI002F92DAC7
MTNPASLQAILPATQPATARTAPARKSSGTDVESFVAALDAAKTTKPDGGSTPSAPIVPLVAHRSRVASPLEQFEGFVLRSFVESMLPSEASSYFGEGTAGEVWRSMMAEEIGNELAKNGGIGIADSIRSREKPAPASGEGTLTAAGGLDRMLRQADLARAGAIRDNVSE